MGTPTPMVSNKAKGEKGRKGAEKSKENEGRKGKELNRNIPDKPKASN